MRKLSLKSIKSRLSFSLILVTFTVFLVFGITYPLILNMFANEVEKNTSERMQNALMRFDDNLNQIQKQVFSLNHSEVFQSVFSDNEGSEYAKTALCNQAAQTLRDIPYINGFSMILRGSDEVLTSNGIYSLDKYFDRFWNNPEYSTDYWKKELYQPFSIRYYPEADYVSYSFGESGRTNTVMPVAFKNVFDNRYMIIVFVNIQDMCQDIDPYILKDFSIYYKGQPMIKGSNPEQADYEKNLKDSKTAMISDSSGYSVICRSSFNDFVYTKHLPIKEVRSGLDEIYLTSFFIIFAALLLSTGVIMIVTKRLSKPFISISKLFADNHLTNEKNLDEWSFIEDNLQNLFQEKAQTAKELEEKNNLLSGFLYQSKLKNIYINIQNDDSFRECNQELSYYLIGFSVFYREDVSAMIHKTYSEISFILKEHLENVLKRYFPSILLLQPEENTFFSKVGLSLQDSSIEAVMDKVMKRLDNEKEYCYFLVAVSQPIKDESLITQDYYHLLELQEQFCLLESSQILFEGQKQETKAYAGLNIQQNDDLKKLISSGDCSGLLHLVSNMLESGLAPYTTRLYANLYCNSIINILIQALHEVFFCLPPEIQVQDVHNQLARCCSEPQFKESVLSFARQITSYTATHSSPEDPLITGVRNYVTKHYTQEFTMDAMADTLKISKSYLSTSFKSKTGTNLIDFIQQYRIQKAIELMHITNIRLADIGNSVGISNPNSFIRVFKKHTGITPSEYRKKMML